MNGSAGSADNGPRPVRASLDHLARLLALAPANVFEKVFSEWDQLVGPAIAAHARPSSLSGGTLVVSVDDPSWGNELRYLSAGLLRVIADQVGPTAPSRMEVRVRPRDARGKNPSVVNWSHRNSVP